MLRKLAVALAAVIYVATISPTRADPGPVVNWLISEPASLFDIGMMRLHMEKFDWSTPADIHVAPSSGATAALWYAAKLDWPVAPAHYIRPDGNCSCGRIECPSPGKHPMTANGFKDATTDLDTIRGWWDQNPEANVILQTGDATGLLVLDIDPDHGGNETLAALEAEHGPLAPTVEQITGSGGRHLLFRFPGPEYRNTAGKVGHGIDSRGAGGYIVVAPSNHRSGNVYRWRDGHKPGQIEIAEAPNWLLDRRRKNGSQAPSQPRTSNGDARAYAEAALADEVKATATAQEGMRNDQLNRSAFALGQLVGSGLLAHASVVGRRIGICPKRQDDWLVVPNLWGGKVGRSGVQKSPAAAEAIRPLRRLAHRAQEQFKAEKTEIEARREILKIQMESIKQEVRNASKKGESIETLQSRMSDLARELEEANPVERRYVVNDATVEKLGELLQENPRGLLLFRDELVGFLRSLEKSGHETDRAFYLEAWNGAGSFDYDRIGRGTKHIPALTVSIVGGMTPGRLRTYLAGALDGGAQDDGLLQRFQLIVWPEVSPEWENVDRYPDTEAKNCAFAVFEALDGLDPLAIGADVGGEIPSLRFAPDAQELFDEWRTKLEGQLRNGELSEALAFESHIAKYRSLMPSLALIFHLMDVVTGHAEGGVSLGASALAADWCDYLKAHARKLYSSELQPNVTAAYRILEKIRLGDIGNGSPIRDIYRNHWSGISTAEQVHGGLEVLARHNWIRIEQQETGGRPTDLLYLHPTLLNGRA